MERDLCRAPSATPAGARALLSPWWSARPPVTPAGAERRAGVHPPPFRPCGRIGGWAPAQGRGDNRGVRGDSRAGRRGKWGFRVTGAGCGGQGYSGHSPYCGPNEAPRPPPRPESARPPFTPPERPPSRHPGRRACPPVTLVERPSSCDPGWSVCPLLSPRPERSGEPGSILCRFGPAEGSEAGPRLKAGAVPGRSGRRAGPLKPLAGSAGGTRMSN